MNLPIALGCLWMVVANVSAMFPSKRSHWPTAYVLITVGLPLLVWIGWENGIWIALLFLIGAASVLRWPVWFLWKWVKRLVGR